MPDGAKEERVLEDVLDELLSFNYRSLRTLRDIFLRPAAMTRAFIAGDRASYTPTMRVWFGVLTWMFLLSIVWGGWGEVMARASTGAHGLDALIEHSGRDPQIMRETISSAAALLYVPLEALFVLPGAMAVRAMRRELSFVQAAQCYFIPVTASTVGSTIVLTLSAFWAGILLVAAPVNLAIFCLVTFRMVGAGLATSRTGQLAKTLILTVLVFALAGLARFITLSASIVWALTQAPPSG